MQINKDLKITEIECYNDASIDRDLKDMIDSKHSIYEQLMIFNDYFEELDEEFDPKKLKPIVTEIGDRVEIITNFTYNETDLSFFKEYGDYWSKGLTYYLN